MELDQQNQNQQQNQPGSKNKAPSTILKVIVLVILIILLVIGILLPIKLVPNALTTINDKISSWFHKDKVVTLSTDKTTINSGEDLTLSWDNAPTKEGTYALNYACLPGVQMQTSIVSPNETIACGGNYYFSTATSSILLKVYSTTARYTEVDVTLSYLENGSTTTNKLADVTLIVSNSNPSVVTPSPTPVATTPATTTQPVATSTATHTPAKPVNPTITRINRISNPNGYTDLSVKIISTGYLTSNGDFVPAASVTNKQRPAVKFVVTNIGDKNSGAWNFTALLPTPFNPSFTANNLPNLGPEDSIAYVLGFDGINNSQYNSASINIDSNMKVGDTNRSNNTVQTTITNVSAH